MSTVRVLRRNLSVRVLTRAWDRYECPTWCVAAAVFGGWLTLVSVHAALPWWAVIALGAWLVAWHGSLQHETIHAFASAPRAVRTAIAWIPLGVFLPFGSYQREHRRHHRAVRLTDPADDPESFYHDAERWRRYPAALRALLRFNQTLAGRLMVGAAIQTVRAVAGDARMILRGDRRRLRDWAVHAVLVAALLAAIKAFTGMPWWQYVALIAYPGLSLGMLRSFYEHRFSPDAAQRTAAIENRFPFGLLFLNNNYHTVHHAAPALPWYRIPAVWQAHRAAFVARSGGYYFSGYGEIVRRWFFAPVFDPVSPSE